MHLECSLHRNCKWERLKPMYSRWDLNILGFWTLWVFCLPVARGEHIFEKCTRNKKRSKYCHLIECQLEFINPADSQKTGQTYVFMFFPFSSPGPSPTRFDSKIRAILMYLCVRSSDVIFYGHQTHFGRFFGQPSGENTFSKHTHTQQHKHNSMWLPWIWNSTQIVIEPY